MIGNIALVRQFPNPDVPEQDGVAVILQLQGALVGVGDVVGDGVGPAPAGAAGQFVVVMNEHAVMKDGEGGAFNDLIPFEDGPMEDNIVGLPFSGFARGIDQGFLAPIERARLAVGIGGVFIGVQDLNFILPHEEHAAVAPSLSLAFRRFGGGELKVQLAGTEFLFGLDHAGVFYR